MGDMDSFGGPLRPEWYEQRRALQKSNVGKMRSFGMTPVLPAFAGHVPPSIKR